MDECEASADVLLSDTMDQYRTFQMCERLLHSPSKLGNQLLFQIPPHRQAILIERCSKDSVLLCQLSDVFPLSDLSVCHIIFNIYVSQSWSSLSVCMFLSLSILKTRLFLETAYFPVRGDISMTAHIK